ncbi:MAG: hypothetical protein ACRECO_13545 [Xanthobacteraceae bacterium]
MDVGALASAFAAAKAGQVQLAIAAKMMRMNADSAAAMVKVIEAAQANLDRLTNVAAGIGANLDITA